MCNLNKFDIDKIQAIVYNKNNVIKPPNGGRTEKIMKKFLSIAIIVTALCASLAACGDNENETGGIIIDDPDESEQYYIPEPDGGTSTENFELGGVPLE